MADGDPAIALPEFALLGVQLDGGAPGGIQDSRDDGADHEEGDVRPETINKRIHDIRQLLDQAGQAIQPGPHRLANLEDLYQLAVAEDIAIPPQTKTAC